MAGSKASWGGGWLTLILIFIQIMVILVLVPTNWLTEMVKKEDQMLVETLGRDAAAHVQEKGWSMYSTVFVNSGVNRYTYNLFIPSDYERRRSRGLEDLGQEFWFPWVRSRGLVTSMLLQQVFERIAQIMVWLPFALIAVVPACIDGYFTWKKRQLTFDYASPFWHRFSIKTAMLLSVLGLVGLFLPLPVPPAITPIMFMFIIPLLGNVLIANMPKKI